MANSTIKKPLISNKPLVPQEEFTFPLVEGTITLLAFGHPYNRACAGLYLIVGGYTTTTNENTIPILATDKVTITKTNGNTCKVVANSGTFMTIIQGGYISSVLRDMLSGAWHECIKDKEASCSSYERNCKFRSIFTRRRKNKRENLLQSLSFQWWLSCSKDRHEKSRAYSGRCERRIFKKHDNISRLTTTLREEVAA